MAAPDDVVLYQYPGSDGIPSLSPPCTKVQLALHRLERAHVVVDLRSPGAARKVSPSGRLPCLHVGSRRIVDSVAILDALEEQRPSRPLSPAEPAARANDRVWEHYANDTLYWLGMALRWVRPQSAERMLDEIAGRSLSSARLAGRLFVIPTLRRRARVQGTGMLPEADVMKAFTRALGVIEDGLAGGPFIGGRSTPGRGDMGVAAGIAQAGFRGTLPDVLAAVKARPAVVAHARRTFEACHLQPPYWLASA